MDRSASALVAASLVEWISAIGQLVGAFGTVAAVVVALWLARRDASRSRAELADREAGQARLITFEVNRRDGHWRVATTNHSNAPVFDVCVTEVRIGDQVGHVEDIPGSPERLDIVPPGESPDQAISFTDLQLEGSYEVTATFLDSAGLRWQRIGAGPPSRILMMTRADDDQGGPGR